MKISSRNFTSTWPLLIFFIMMMSILLENSPIAPFVHSHNNSELKIHQATQHHTRIKGGSTIKYSDFPFHVGFSLEADAKPFCGGSLIGPRFVLTAAHCIVQMFDDITSADSTNCKMTTVFIGTSNWIDCPQEVGTHKNCTRVRVKSWHFPDMENFNNTKLKDIAILELEESLNIPKYPKLSLNDPPFYSLHNIVGWGLVLDSDGKTARTYDLHAAKIPVLDKECCNNEDYILNEFNICAGLKNGIDTCNGDSGGSLSIKQSDGSFIISGVVAFGTYCEEPDSNGAYTSVSYFQDWIWKKTSGTVSFAKIQNGTIDYITPVSKCTAISHGSTIFQISSSLVLFILIQILLMKN